MKREKDVKELLLELAEPNYKSFSSALMPTVKPDTVIGVRVPKVREVARRIYGSEAAREFMLSLPHKHFEENNLHAFLIERIEDFDECIAELESFLPYVDNWATCDSMRPKCLSKKKKELLPYVKKWIRDSHTYTVRFAIELLMLYYLDEDFSREYFDMVADAACDEYYVNMMIAWYFATALAKRWDEAIAVIREKRLPMWIHNKTISKAVDSYRITDEKKAYLRSLRIK